MKRVLTGLQPTGVITLGNYIGSIRQMIKYQDEYKNYLFVLLILKIKLFLLL